MRTLVVGAAIVDLMMKVERLPKGGEDIPCKETKTVVGGCAYNVANTLRNLNCEHDLCVPVGSGSFADSAVEATERLPACDYSGRFICRYYPQRHEGKRI